MDNNANQEYWAHQFRDEATNPYWNGDWTGDAYDASAEDCNDDWTEEWYEDPYYASAEGYLQRDGLSFDFKAGDAPYKYQVAIGNGGDDVLVGGKARDYFWGLDGNDQIAGRSGDNVAYGDSGDDIITGKAGSDRLSGGIGDDRVFGGAGNDLVIGGAGNDYLDEGAGHGDLDGGPGNDVLVGGWGPDAFGIGPMSGDDVIKDFTPGPGMFDHLVVRDLRWDELSFADTAEGAKVSWTGGSVLLENVLKSDLAQDDFMFGHAPYLPPGMRPADGPSYERDTPSSGGPKVYWEELPGGDYDYAADDALWEDGLQFTFEGDESYQVAVGTSRKNTLEGGAAADHFFGRDGNDTLIGNDGDDVLLGDAGRDELYGGMGMDKLDGSMGADRLFGGDDSDGLMGAKGKDYLDAGDGHDMVEGGMGNDTLIGGMGADAFIVDPDSGFDVVLDFESGGEAQGAFDHLALEDILPEQVSVTDTSRGALISWDTDGDSEAEGSVLVQDVFKADLRQSDFMFVNAPGFVAGIEDIGSQYIFPL